MLKFIKEIKITFSPFREESKNARQFLSRISADSARQSNLECKVKASLSSNMTTSSQIYIQYSNIVYMTFLGDGKILNLRPDKVKYLDLVTFIDKYSKRLALIADLKENK